MFDCRIPRALSALIIPIVMSAAASTLFAGTPTIADARYDVRTAGERLDVVIALQLRQTDNKPGRLSLDLGELSLKTATLDGKPAAVQRDRIRPSRLIVACSAKKRSTLQLRLSSKMRSIGRDFEVRLPLIAEAPATIRATVPAMQSLLVGGTRLPRLAKPEQSNVYTFPAGNHEYATLRFTSGNNTRKIDPVLLATSAIKLFVTRAGVRWQSETTIDAVGKNQTSLEVKTPGRLKITNVSADGMLDSKIAEADSDDGETIIRLRFARSKSRRVVRLTGLIAPGAEPIWNVPNLKITAVDGHAGRIVVHADEKLKLRVDEFAGVSERILPKQTGNVVPASATQDRVDNSTRRLGFEFWKQDFELALAIPKRRDELAIDTNAVVTIQDNSASLVVKTTCTRGTVPQTLRVNIPAGWAGFRVRCNGRPVRWKLEPFEAGMQRIVISMPTNANKQPTIDVHATHQLAADNENGSRELSLPVVRCDDATRTNGRIAIRAPASQHLAGTGLQRMRTVLSKTDRERYTDLPDRITYAYTLRAGEDAIPQGTLKIRRGSQTPSVESLVWFSKQHDKLLTRQVMQITPAEVGVTQLKVNVKAKSLDDVAFRCMTKGRKMSATRISSIGGQQSWRLTFSPPLTSPTLVEASITAGVLSEKTMPPQLRIEDVAAAIPHIALAGSNREWLTIHATRTAGGKESGKPSSTYRLQRVLPRDLPGWMRAQIKQSAGDSVVRVYRRPSPSYSLHLRNEQPETQSDTVRIEQMRLVASLTPAGVMQTRATLTIHGTAGRKLRIQLPDGATLNRMTVDGRPALVTRRPATHRLSIPVDKHAQRQIVEMSYTSNLGRLTGVRTLSPELPAVFVENDRQSPVLHAECLLHLPAGVRAVAAEGSFESQSTLKSSSWLSAGFGRDDSASTIHLRHITVNDNSPQLSLTVAETAGGLRLRLAVMLAFMLVLWRMRKLPLRHRGLTAVVAAASSAVLALWAPAAWAPCLDGMFLGTLLGSVMWALPAVCSHLSATCGRLRAIRPTRKLLRPTTVGIAVAILSGSTNNGIAADSDALVSSAKYEIRISAKTATVDAEYRIHHAQAAPVKVAIPLGRVALTSAELNGQKTDVSWRADKAKHLLLHVPVTEKGWNRLSLEFSLPIERQSGGRVLQLPTYPVAAGTAMVHLDDPSLQVVVPDLNLKGALKKNGGRVEFPLDGMTGVEMRLLSPTKAKQRRGIVESQATTELTISDHGVMQRDRFRLRMRSGAMQRMTFDIPAGRKLLGVEGDNIAGWDVLLVGDAGYALMVDFKRPVRSTTSLTFRTFKPVNITSEPTAFAFDRVTPTIATTIAETVNVVADADLAVSESDVRQALRIAPSRVRRVNTGNNATRLAYRLTSPDSKVTFKISRPGSKVRVVSQHQAHIGTHAVRYSSKMRFRISGRPKSRFALFLPEGFQLQSLTGDNSVEWSFGEDKTMLNVTFPKPQTRSVGITIKGAMPRSGSSPTAEVSIPSAMMANTVENSVSVTAAPVYRIAPGEIEGWKPVQSSKSDGALSFYSTDVEAAPVGIQLTPRVDKSDATSWTVIQPTRDGVKYLIILHWAPAAAAKRLVAFHVPAWLRPFIRVQAQPGQVVQRDPKTIPDDSPQRWFVLQSGKTNQKVIVTAEASLPWSIAENNGFRAPLLTMETAKQPIDIDDAVDADFVSVKSARRYAIVIQSSEFRVQTSAKIRTQLISTDDMPWIPAHRNELSKVIELLGVCYALNPTKDEPIFKRIDTPLPLNADSIPRAALTTVVQNDGRYHTTAIYKVRNHSRRFVAVVLPEDAATSSFAVNGKPTHGLLEKHDGKSFTLIPIPRSVGEDPISVQVTWTGRLPHEVSRRNWILPAARIVTPAESRQYGLSVAGTVWRVQLPPGMTGDALDDPGQMNLTLLGESLSGRTLTLQKPGGQPRMALSVRSEAAVQTGVSFFASLVWLTAAAFACAAIWKLRPAKTQAMDVERPSPGRDDIQ